MPSSASNSFQIGLFIIRVGFGIFYVLHGWPKISGGVETWTAVGGSMGLVGINFAPAFWGFMAALAEFGGGLLLIFGFLTRPAAAFMLFTMLIATIMHVSQGDPINTVMNPLKGLVVFLGLLFTGGGVYSVDYRLFGRRG